METKNSITILETVLRKHPLFKITDFKINKPADQKSFELFTQKYGYELHPDLTRLYAEMNGFTLKYELTDSSDDAIVKFNNLSKYRAEEPPFKMGSINFLPFEEAFMDDTWEGILYNTNSSSDNKDFIFKGKNYTYNSFGERLKPFDMYSDESCAAFILTEANRFDVILLQDNYVAWKDSLITDFATYFKLILLTGGLIEARDLYLTELKGDEQPKFKIKNPKSLVPKFFNSMLDDLLNA